MNEKDQELLRTAFSFFPSSNRKEARKDLASMVARGRELSDKFELEVAHRVRAQAEAYFIAKQRLEIDTMRCTNVVKLVERSIPLIDKVLGKEATERDWQELFYIKDQIKAMGGILE